MVSKFKFFIILIFLYNFYYASVLSKKVQSRDINWWCNQTPYPGPCKHFMPQNQNQNQVMPKHKTDFRKMTIELALEHTIKAKANTKLLGPKFSNVAEKHAWLDCLKLYENTIKQLYKTINTNANFTDFDTQTWLSAALTNLETCKTGFVELGVSDKVLPLMSNNVSQLISNTLALGNNNTTHETSDNKAGFPSWVSGEDQKLLESTSDRADLVVAQDGTGNFRTINAALDAATQRSNGNSRFIILVKRGVYEENLEVGMKLRNITLVGDGMEYTIITGSRSVGGGSTTYNSATVAVTGDGFIATSITFRNTAGPKNQQAVALRSDSDLSVFYQCGFEGYQDTLYVHSQRQFYKDCYIYGTVDFIFGNAIVVFQNCMIYARRPMPMQKNTITAQDRTDPNQNTGISIQNSRVMASKDLVPVLSSYPTFLGRPWGEYSRTVFMQTYLGNLVDPSGWLEWDGNFGLNTLYYGEYKNYGPSSGTDQRVRWKGYQVITSAAEAERFTVANFIGGESWLPSTGVPFTAGL